MKESKITRDSFIKSIPRYGYINFTDLARKLGVAKSTLSNFLAKNDIPEIHCFSAGARVKSFKRKQIDARTNSTTRITVAEHRDTH